MSQTLVRPSVIAEQQRRAATSPASWDDVSPFGLQGLRRQTLRILDSECIHRLAVALALTANRRQIEDDQFVVEFLDRRPTWRNEYQVVRLIEKSLWINGQSDLVMTLTPNPSQIPDSPPAEITDALTKAYVLHPQGTIWYGVPLFGEETNAEGLPIPVTAAQVQTEAQRRITAAREHALRWGWAYRLAANLLRIPALCWRTGQMAVGHIRQTIRRCADIWNTARRDARLRAHAQIVAQMQHCRTGRTWVEIPEHTTWLGRMGTYALEALFLGQRLIGIVAGIAGVSAVPMLINTLTATTATIIVPLTIVSADPFLFIELPDEPGKLRHLGHWYWQGPVQGNRKLHLHA